MVLGHRSVLVDTMVDLGRWTCQAQAASIISKVECLVLEATTLGRFLEVPAKCLEVLVVSTGVLGKMIHQGLGQ